MCANRLCDNRPLGTQFQLATSNWLNTLICVLHRKSLPTPKEKGKLLSVWKTLQKCGQNIRLHGICGGNSIRKSAKQTKPCLSDCRRELTLLRNIA